MSLPSKKIKKIKLPNDVEGNETYEIIPEMLGKNGYSAELPTLTKNSVICLIDDLNTTLQSYYTKTQSNDRFALKDEANKMVEITWTNLKTLRDNSQLVKGMQYRITDYVTTTTQVNTSSAGHSFDVIVVADDINVLNENARAIKHSGDTYFANCNLST